MEVALNDITDRQAVRAAMAEYLEVGQEAFLARYGFGKSRGWLLVDKDGTTYDAKAILGVAHGYQIS